MTILNEGVSDTALAPGEHSRNGLPAVEALRGWFQIGWSAEFASERAVPLRYFGEDLAAFRTAEGELVVFGAFCEHLGAHLGHGGRVDGDCLVCPFHGWKWDSAGANVEIPYSTKINRAKRLKRWHTVERDGVVYLWHDPAGAAPTWEAPTLIGEDTDYYALYPECVWSWDRVRVHPQLSLENTADAAHFKYVHLASQAARVARFEPNGPAFDVVFELPMGRPDRKTWLAGEGGVVAQLDARAWGVGMMSVCFGGADNAINLLSTTPIDQSWSRMMSSVWIPRDDRSDGGELPDRAQARVAEQVKQVGRDIVIWENMTYVERPPYPPEESREFLALRRWASQFYVTKDQEGVL